MRTIVCRFRDEAQLSQHLVWSAQTFEPPRALSFLGEFEAAAHESVRVVIVVEEHAEQCSVRVVLGPGLAHNTQALWRYIGRIIPEDRVWLEMMLQKMRTMDRFKAAC